MPECLLCQKGLPVEVPRVCPICGHIFQGHGWGGIDAHWRALNNHADHEGFIAYRQFWHSMCEAHRHGWPE